MNRISGYINAGCYEVALGCTGVVFLGGDVDVVGGVGVVNDEDGFCGGGCVATSGGLEVEPAVSSESAPFDDAEEVDDARASVAVISPSSSSSLSIISALYLSNALYRKG